METIFCVSVLLAFPLLRVWLLFEGHCSTSPAFAVFVAVEIGSDFCLLYVFIKHRDRKVSPVCCLHVMNTLVSGSFKFPILFFN